MTVVERVQTRDPEISKEALHNLAIENAEVILAEQDPVTGFFSAATKEHKVDEGHYGEIWVRDNATTVDGLLAIRPYLQGEIKDRCTQAIKDNLGKSLVLFTTEPWQERFGQEIIKLNGSHTRLSQAAPSVHLKPNGQECAWRQNQPDSWGGYVKVWAKAFDQGIIEANEERLELLKPVPEYLLRLEIENFECSSMWEDEEVHSPPPLSTVLIVKDGLVSIKKYFPELEPQTDQMAARVDEFSLKHFPRDVTWKNGHRTDSDLATMVAFSYGDHPNLSYSTYLDLANAQLGNGESPGKIRFGGDPYYIRDDKEAEWRMSKKMEADMEFRESLRAFESGDSEVANQYKKSGERKMIADLESTEAIGWDAELLEMKDGKYVPNDNDLLWNRALTLKEISSYFNLLKYMDSGKS